jgi:hypothetical protein
MHKLQQKQKRQQHWSDVGWICQNWGNALKEVGQLWQAREIFHNR